MADPSTAEDTNTASSSRDRASSPPSLRWAKISSAFRGRNFRPRTPSNSNDVLRELRKLHDPPNATIDLIFVHGLGGDLEKSWSVKDREASFWPRDWLPDEEALQHVRIHTFGYSAALKEKKRTALDLVGLGRLLATELEQSKLVGDVPIVFVAHSMGGLITKQAFLCAYNGASTNNIYSRIRGMIFLAVPHQGSDWPKYVEKISQIYSLPRYVKDLSRGSEILVKINEEFKKLAHHLLLWSFYELCPTPVSKRSSYKVLVVDQSSARIDLPHESIEPLDADHRQICKFNTRSDDNYQSVRHAIVTTVERILNHGMRGVLAIKSSSLTVSLDNEENERKAKGQMHTLKSRLHISVSPEEDLEVLLLDRVEGSCGWILQHEKFSQWRETGKSSPAVFWLTGNPGTGKSTLSAHVIKHLQDQGESICYYFCQTGGEQQGASDLIRHLAFQMAQHHPMVREALIAREQAWQTIQQDDAQLLWKRLFTDTILTLPLGKRQTWIIDGLDECRSVQKAMILLSNIASKGLPPYPISLYLSSRTTYELQYSAFSGAEIQLAIDPRDTENDIKRYIAAQSQLFRRLDPADKKFLEDALESRADACFLWLRLVINNMKEFRTATDKKESVEHIPERLTLLYREILEQMEKGQRGHEISITRAILTWTAHVFRDLHQEELRAAILNDLEKDINPAMETVEYLCGQLIRVHRNGVVRPAHFTVTEFLRNDRAVSYPALESSNAHERLAIVCLEYLSGPEFEPPPVHELLVSERAVRSPMADYAATYWSNHVMMASSGSDHLAERIHGFLSTNVLSWIEFVATQKRSLYDVIQTAKNLRNYLDRRAKHVSPISRHYSEIDRWITDLLRVSTKFGKNLVLYPSAIHFITPPLCPKNSSIYTTFPLHRDRGISLKGASLMDWDDCISYTEYQGSNCPSAVACAQNVFAIGLISEYVKVFDNTTLQERASMHHGEPVLEVLFDSSGTRVASAGWSMVRLWTVDGELVWEDEVRNEGELFMTFSSLHHSLTIHKEDGEFFSWRTEDGTKLAVPKETSKLERMSKRVLSSSMSDDLSIIAIAFDNASPQVWSLRTGTRLGKCEMNGASASQILLNPRAYSDGLAITYNNNVLANFSTMSQRLIGFVKTEATVLACTPDGLTLATGDRSGNIKLWDFETLRLMYCIASPNDTVQCLAFSLDGLRLFDLRPHRSMIWEPSALVRKNSPDSSTISDSVHGEDVDIPVYNHQERAVISAMLVIESIGFIVIGKHGGAVCAYDIATGVLSSTLYSHHRFTRITCISFTHEKKHLATADSFSEIIVKQLETFSSDSTMRLRADTLLLQISPESGVRSPIRQISFSPDGSHLLVRRSLLQTVCISEPNVRTSCTGYPETGEALCFAWLKSENTAPMIVAAECRGSLRLIHYDATSGSTTSGSRVEILNHQGERNDLAIKRLLCGVDNEYIVVELHETRNRGLTAPAVLVYRIRDVMIASEIKAPTGGTTPIKPIAYLMAGKFISLLGYLRKKLVFLDTNLWIRSYRLANIPAEANIVDLDDAARHMFINSEIAAETNSVPGEATRSSAIFSKRGEIVVIQDALTWSL